MIKANMLPKEYQEVEYIESNGLQYINTGYIPTENVKIDIEFNFVDWQMPNANLFGCDTGAYQRSCLSLGRSVQGLFAFCIGSTSKQFEEIVKEINYHVIISKDKLIINDNVHETTFSASFTDPVSLCLLGWNRNGTYLSNTEGNDILLYRFKIYDNNVLVRDMIPCYRKSDNIAGMYDLVNNVFYTNQGTGTFTVGNDIQSKVKRIATKVNNVMQDVKYIKTKINNAMVKVFDILPKEYQRVEYLESTGTQIIKTGVVGDCIWKPKLQGTQNTSKVGGLILRASDDGHWFGILESGYGVYGINRSNRINILYTTLIEPELVFTTSLCEYKVNGLTQTFIPTVNHDDDEFQLFGISVYTAYAKLYYAKCYQNDVLVRDFVPCYRKSDNVAGLYDLVNDVFYTNAGTGTFIVGNDI